MHGPINVKSPNNISEWQMGFISAFKGLTASWRVKTRLKWKLWQKETEKNEQHKQKERKNNQWIGKEKKEKKKRRGDNERKITYKWKKERTRKIMGKDKFKCIFITWHPIGFSKKKTVNKYQGTKTKLLTANIDGYDKQGKERHLRHTAQRTRDVRRAIYIDMTTFCT